MDLDQGWQYRRIEKTLNVGQSLVLGVIWLHRVADGKQSSQVDRVRSYRHVTPSFFDAYGETSVKLASLQPCRPIFHPSDSQPLHTIGQSSYPESLRLFPWRTGCRQR